MRSFWKVALAACLVAVPQLAAADDVEEQLQQMQERMGQLEEKLTATTDQLEASEERAAEQQKMIERAGLEERSALSGVSSFFEQVEFGGWVTASYVYNLNDPPEGANFPGGVAAPNTGTFLLANPFHPDSNTFQLDQLWFEMSKKPTEDSRAGFAADIVMGKTADRLVGSTPGIDSGATTFGNGNNVAVFQAYAEYLAPLGPGVSIKGGRYATPIGVEMVQSVYNWNITRGLVWSVLQPINHVGIYASSEFDNGFSLGVGVANTALQNRNTDFDDEKTVIWQLGYTQDAWGLRFSGLYGGDNSASTLGPCGGGGLCASKDDVLLLDGVLTWDPSENLSTWVDVTYQQLFGNGAGAAGPAAFGPLGETPWAIGVAMAGRLAITEATGFALRGEYLRSEDNFLGTAPSGATNQNLWSLTGTVDHALTENLTAKAEVRYEEGSQVGAEPFYIDGPAGATNENQVLLAADVTYRF